jgi:pantoate--beta-alanine ligase
MQIFKDIEVTRSFIQSEKRAQKRIGLVPTMGALHNGHLSLVRKSLAETDSTIASIFVNPLQFNNAIDLDKYPRTIDRDLEMLASAGCHSAFIPTAKIMYQKPTALSLNFGELEKVLEGKFRPGHFSGVGVVVAKFFNIIQPDFAYFGQKDFQQFLIIKQMVDDLNFPLQVKCGEIVREADGLAMSSRNTRLSSAERKLAPILYQTLSKTKELLSTKKLDEIRMEATKKLTASNIKLEYLELANQETLQLLQTHDKSIPSILLIAAYVGEVRLIDNILI